MTRREAIKKIAIGGVAIIGGFHLIERALNFFGIGRSHRLSAGDALWVIVRYNDKIAEYGGFINTLTYDSENDLIVIDMDSEGWPGRGVNV